MGWRNEELICRWVTRRAGAPEAAISACKAPGRPGRRMLRIQPLWSTTALFGAHANHQARSAVERLPDPILVPKSTAHRAKEVRRKLDHPSRGANRLVCQPVVSEGSL